MKFTLCFNIFQKWIMTDSQKTVAAYSLLANAVLLVSRRAGDHSLAFFARMWNSDHIMYNCYFSFTIHLGW